MRAGSERRDSAVRSAEVEEPTGSAALGPYRAPLDEIDADTFDDLVALNLRAPLLMVRRARQALRASGGRIVLCSSSSSQRLLPGEAAYTATRGGIEGMARALAVELAPDGIAVNVVSPGLTAVPRTAEAAWWGRLDAEAPPCPFGTADDAARVLAMLLDPRPALVSGNVLIVDGGLHVHSVPAAPRSSPDGTRRARWDRRLPRPSA